MQKILWFDIETVAETSAYGNYPKKQQRAEKTRSDKFPGMTEEESYFKNAGIYPEFARVVCISTHAGGVTKSFGHRGSEKKTIQEFFEYLDQLSDWTLGGYNIIGFDIPFLWKRCVILGIKPHKKLCVGNIKPRERNEVDVMQIRKQGSFTCSLDLLCITLLGHSPKTGEVNASNVFDVFNGPRPSGEAITEDSRMKKIIQYCEKDVEYTARCYDKIQQSIYGGVVQNKKQPVEHNDDIEHLLPQGAVEVKGDATDKQRNYIKVLWKNVEKYMMVPGFTEMLDEYLQAVYQKKLDGLDRYQASGLVAKLSKIKSNDSPHVEDIRSILLPQSEVDDGLPF